MRNFTFLLLAALMCSVSYGQLKVSNSGTSVINEGSITGFSFGKSYSSNLGYGTSYMGFNAIRNSTTGIWRFNGDGANNGGSTIYSTVGGNMNFVTIPSSGANFKDLTDAQILTNVKMSITSDGKVGIGITGPSQKLQVEGNSYLNGNTGIGVSPHSTAKLYVSGTSILNGSIAINMTAIPSYPLHVNGKSYLSDNAGIGVSPHSTAKLYVSGTSILNGSIAI
jgi:hypothetical protein